MSNFDVSALSAYAQLNSKEIATKAIANAATAKLLLDNSSAQFNIKGSAPVLKLSNSVVLQDGSSCGRTAAGDTVLSNKLIYVKNISDYKNICPKTLDNTYFSVFASAGANPEGGIEAAMASKIMNTEALNIAAVNEQLLWVGDTSLTGSTNLNRVDGIVKQVTGASYVNLSAATTGSTVVEKLQNAYMAMPIVERSQADFRIFVGEDLYSSYLIALANKNIYKLVDDFKLFGTTATIQVAPGLNGTNSIVLTRISNLVLGLDGVGDSEKADFRYSTETKQWYLDFDYALGVVIVWPETVGYTKVA